MKTYFHFRSIIAVFAILFIASNSFAQVQPPVTTIPTLTCQEGTFTVPVTVKHFNGVGNISLSLNYDPTKLTYENINVNNAIPIADLITTTPPDISGNIRLSYSGTSGITLPDESVLFTLTFSVKPGVSGVNTPVVWSTIQGACELSPPSPDVFSPLVTLTNFSTYFVNGSVGIKTIPTISGPNSVCPGSTGNIYTTQSGMSNYTWSVSAGGSITAGNGTNSITVTWPASVGSHSVSVSYTDPANGCPAATPTVFPVNTENTVTPTISGPNNVCEGSSGQVYSTQPGMTNYHWSITGGSITSGGGSTNNTATITWTTHGVQTLTVSYDVPGGCSTVPSGYTVTVNPTVGTPTAITVITGSDPTCQLSDATTKTTYSTTALNSSGFEWSISNNAAGTIEPSTGIMTWANGFSGSVDIRVRALGCNGPSSQVIRTVVVSPNVGTPTPITVSGGTEPTMQVTAPTTTTTTYSTTAVGSNGFIWSLSNPAAGIINPTTGVMTWANAFSGSVDIRVTANGCSGPSAQVIRTVTLAPKSGPSSDIIPITTIPTLHCQVDNVIVPVTVRNFNGIGNISLVLNFDQTKLLYTGVVVNPALQPENVISTVPYSPTGQFRLSYAGSNGITLQDNTVLFTLTLAIKKGVSDFTSPLTWSTLQGECDYSPPAPGFYNTPISPANFSTYFINGSAAINAVPIITGPNSVCPGSGGNVYTTEAGMSNYNWNVSAGGIITAGAGTNSITVTWPASVSTYTVSVSYVDPTFECSVPTTTYYPVNVESIITPTLIGPNNICQESTGNVYTTEPNMSNYHWIVTGGTITSGGNSSSNTATITWNTSGDKTVSVDYTPAGGCTSTPTVYHVSVTATVGTPTPITISTGFEPTCQLTNATTTTTYSTTANDNTGFNWSLSNPSAGTINPTTGVMTWANGFSGVVDIRVTANGCNGPSAQTYRRVTVGETPSKPVVGTITQPTCGIATGSVVLSGLPTGNWTINPGNINGTGLTTTLNNLAPGTYNYSVTNATGCTSPLSDNIVINNPPSLPNWNGSVNSDWNNAANWCSNAVPTASDNVTIQTAPHNLVIKASLGLSAVCNNMTVESGAVFTIEPGAALTVNGTLTNNSLGGIIIQSDATGTGSLITNAVGGTGTTIAQRYMTTGAWHIVSSPISGQSVANFIATNSHLATSSNGISRGMMDYDPVNNKWNNFFTDGISNGYVGGARGFSMRTTTNDIVSFNGTLQAGTQTVTGLIAGYWNCVGNPYSSAIGINNTSSTPNNFLQENALNAHKLNPSYSCVYIWDQPDASNGFWGRYLIISNTPINTGFHVQQGQAFMILMNYGETSLTFNKNMQGHLPSLSLKATQVTWPHIRLHVTSGNMTGTTYIAFNSTMSKGLDPTYDAGLLKGGADLAVYSHLVTDNKGIPFAIQALPDNESGMIVPIGLDFNTGGQVVFSSETINMPSDCKVFLEDLIERTITDLSKGNYKVTIDPKSSLKDRFRLYTSKAINGVDKGTLTTTLNAYADRNIEIRVIGYVGKNTVATLYDVHGRIVLTRTLEEGSLNIIPLKNNKIGAYILSVNDNGKVKGFKILVRE